MEKGGNSNILQQIMDIKRKIEKTEKINHLLTAENFEYEMKCNRLLNILANMEQLYQSSPSALLKSSNNLSELMNLMHTCSAIRSQAKAPQEKSPVASKAHVVKPHMVNGNILYIPTINLTRVSTSSNQYRVETRDCGNAQNESDNNNTSTLNNGGGNMEAANEVEVANVEDNSDFQVERENMSSDDLDVSQGSSAKSHSHSTVLSGTFQEVKIYCNQISHDSLNESQQKPRSGHTSPITKRRKTPRRGSKRLT